MKKGQCKDCRQAGIIGKDLIRYPNGHFTTLRGDVTCKDTLACRARRKAQKEATA